MDMTSTGRMREDPTSGQRLATPVWSWPTAPGRPAAVPAIGCRGEDGPEEIAAAGGGIELVAPGDHNALAHRIDALLSDRDRLAARGREARATVEREFTWEKCGSETVAAYQALLDG